MYHHSTIGDIKQGNKRATSNTSAKYKWGRVDIKIQEIESQNKLNNKTADLYDPNFCYPDNYGCSHNIGGFVSMKKQNRIQLVFKSQCTSMNKRLSNLEVHLHSRNIKSNTLSPLQNIFLPPSKQITLKSNHFTFPMKDKDICDYDPRCIMSSGLMFDDIIMDHIKRI